MQLCIGIFYEEPKLRKLYINVLKMNLWWYSESNDRCKGEKENQAGSFLL